MEPLTVVLQGLFRKHELAKRRNGNPKCRCGKIVVYEDDHAAHLAQVVAALIAERNAALRPFQEEALTLDFPGYTENPSNDVEREVNDRCRIEAARILDLLARVELSASR